MKLLLLLLLITLVLVSTQAEARTFSLDIIQSHGPKEVSRQEAIGMFKFAQARLAEAGIKIKLRRCSFTGKRNPAVNITNWPNQFYWWAKQGYSKRLLKNQLLYIMLPPFWDEIYWIGGQAYAVCGIRRTLFSFAVGNAELVTSFGVDRWYHSAMIMVHELGHLFGARHIDTDTIMNPGATGLPVSMVTLPWDIKSIQQIQRCIG